MLLEFEGKHEIFFSVPPYQDVLDEDVAPPHPLHKDVPGLSHLHLAACPDLCLELLHLVVPQWVLKPVDPDLEPIEPIF